MLSSVVSSTCDRWTSLEVAFLSMLIYIICQLLPFHHQKYSLFNGSLRYYRKLEVPTNFSGKRYYKGSNGRFWVASMRLALHIHSDSCKGPCPQHFTRWYLSHQKISPHLLLFCGEAGTSDVTFIGFKKPYSATSVLSSKCTSWQAKGYWLCLASSGFNHWRTDTHAGLLASFLWGLSAPVLNRRLTFPSLVIAMELSATRSSSSCSNRFQRPSNVLIRVLATPSMVWLWVVK